MTLSQPDVGENTKVAIRLRPLLAREIAEGSAQCWTADGPKTLTCDPSVLSRAQEGYARREFDRVFDIHEDNDVVYEESCKELIQGSLSGVNGTVFAYGQTGTGKTYTISGLMHSSIMDVFSTMAVMEDRDFLVRMSMIEVYNEHLRDLLSKDTGQGTPPHIKETAHGQVVLEGVEETFIKSAEEFMDELQKGNERRQTRSTAFNEKSSRSHLIVRVCIQSAAAGAWTIDPEGGATHASTMLESTINFVDLAGSERAGEAESRQINKSLLFLGQVVNELANRSSKPGQRAAVISWRNSMLTRVLQPALTGNSRMSIICTASPATTCVEPTRNTVNFANIAGRVKVMPRRNEVVAEKDLLRAKELEVLELKRQLALARAGMDNSMAAQYQSRISNLETEKDRLTAKFANLYKFVLRAGSSSAPRTGDMTRHSIDVTAALAASPEDVSPTFPAPPFGAAAAGAAAGHSAAGMRLSLPAAAHFLASRRAPVLLREPATRPRRADDGAAGALPLPAAARQSLLDYYLLPREVERRSQELGLGGAGAAAASLGAAAAATAAAAVPGLQTVQEGVEAVDEAAEEDNLMAVLEAEVRMLGHTARRGLLNDMLDRRTRISKLESEIQRIQVRQQSLEMQEERGQVSEQGGERAWEIQTETVRALSREVEQLRLHQEREAQQESALRELRSFIASIAATRKDVAAQRSAVAAAPPPAWIQQLVRGVGQLGIPAGSETDAAQTDASLPHAAATGRLRIPAAGSELLDGVAELRCPSSSSVSSPQPQECLEEAGASPPSRHRHLRDFEQSPSATPNMQSPNASSGHPTSSGDSATGPLNAARRPQPDSVAAAAAPPGTPPLGGEPNSSPPLPAGTAAREPLSPSSKHNRQRPTALDGPDDLGGEDAGKPYLDTPRRQELAQLVQRLEARIAQSHRDLTHAQEQCQTAMSHIDGLEQTLREMHSESELAARLKHRLLMRCLKGEYESCQLKEQKQQCMVQVDELRSRLLATPQGGVVPALDLRNVAQQRAQRDSGEVEEWAEFDTEENLMTRIIRLWHEQGVPLLYRARFYQRNHGCETFLFLAELHRLEHVQELRTSSGPDAGSRESRAKADAIVARQRTKLGLERQYLVQRMREELSVPELGELFQQFQVPPGQKRRKPRLAEHLWHPTICREEEMWEHSSALILRLDGDSDPVFTGYDGFDTSDAVQRLRLLMARLRGLGRAGPSSSSSSSVARTSSMPREHAGRHASTASQHRSGALRGLLSSLTPRRTSTGTASAYAPSRSSQQSFAPASPATLHG